MAGPAADLSDDLFRARLERDALVPFLQRQRWFGGKARTIAGAHFIDWAPLTGGRHPAWIAIADVRYEDGGAERYHLPLTSIDDAAAGRGQPESVLDMNGPALCDGVMDDDVCRAMLAAIVRGAAFSARHGVVTAHPLANPAIDEAPSVSRLPGVHSNSAVALDGRYLLKLFRRIEAGVNPDVEIGQMLARAGADVQVPALIGTIEYRSEDGSCATLALVQQLVKSQGNAWDYTLDALAPYFTEAQACGEMPEPGIARRLAHGVIDSISLLGRRTAELHRALASATAEPAFVPEQCSRACVEALVEGIRAQSAATLERLAGRAESLDAAPRALARDVLARRQAVLSRLAHVGSELQPFTTIRIHGDYHLGQVLRVQSDFVIIDFEGEPTRSLDERRAKQSPLRDVAGMLRSLSYAAHAGLRAAAADEGRAPAALAPWARAWEAAAAGAFVRGYLAAANRAAFLPNDATQFSRALDMFVIEKALYELDYEMNNRPAWVSIPLTGILSLVDTGSAA